MRTAVASNYGRAFRAITALALIGLILGCEDIQRLGDKARPATPHERYAAKLVEAGLGETVLGRSWRSAAQHAVAVPTVVSVPFSETMYFPASEPRATAYRVVVRRGQRLVATVETAAGSQARVFVDMFALGQDAALRSVEATELDSGQVSLVRESEYDSSYVVRVQPELLESARVTIVLRAEPMLAFPLPNATNRNVQSFWGASRDGGRRQHQGVDIFAPKGTPVLAVATGYISHVGTSRLGGNVVFLRDRRGQNIYYAHLDQQLVRDGQEVKPGDTVGTVGNTGNARSTPPHLHFGIYRRGQGAIDPFHFIRRVDDGPPPLLADTSLFGKEARIAAAVAEVRASPAARAATTARLERNSPVIVEGASGDWLRVRGIDGLVGYVAARLAEPATEPIRLLSARVGETLRERPDSAAVMVSSLTDGMQLAVLGSVDGYLLVRTPAGVSGWMESRQATREAAGL